MANPTPSRSLTHHELALTLIWVKEELTKSVARRKWKIRELGRNFESDYSLLVRVLH